MLSKEQIIEEIKSAMTLNTSTKATCNEALTHAMSLIVHELKELEGNLEKEYHRGLTEAWEIARELCKTGYKECTEMFGDENVEFVIKNFNPLKVKSIIDTYKEEKEKERAEFYANPLHWDNNKRRRCGLPVLRGRINKYRSKRYPSFHPTARLMCIIEDTIDEVLIDSFKDNKFFEKFVDYKDMALGDANVFYVSR